MNWLITHVLAWTTAAATTLTVAQIFAPKFMDIILDIMVVVLVWVAAKLASLNAEKNK